MTPELTRAARLRFLGRRTPFVALLVVTLVVATAGAAFAFFGASTSVNVTGSAGTIAAPTGFTATPTSPTTVHLSWTAPANVTGYTLAQSSGTLTGCSGTPIPAATSCDASGLTPSTSYTWTLTAVFHNWTASAQAAAATGVAPTNLTFTTQPASGQTIQATGTATFSVSAAIQDAGGATVATDARSVTLAINHDAGPGGVLTCTNAGGLTVTPGSGIANFTGCAITKAGAGYTLTVSTSPALAAPTNGTSFNITAGNAGSLALGFATTTPTAGGADNLTMTAKDVNGNTATTYAGDKSVTFGGPGTIGANIPTVSSKTGVATNFGTATTLTFAGGVSTVSGANNGVMKLYKAESATLTATAGAISSGSGPAVTVTAAPPSALCITSATACTGTTVSGDHGFTFTSHVGLVDQFGNSAVATSTFTVSMTQTGKGSGVSTSGSMTVAAGQSATPGTFTGTASGASKKDATNSATSSPVLTPATVGQST